MLEYVKEINIDLLAWEITSVGAFDTYLGKLAFEQTEQIVKGYKKGWNKY